MIDEILSKFNTTFDDLSADEQETLNSWLTILQKAGSMTTSQVRDYISSMKMSVEKELTEMKETPKSWLSLLSLLIPLIGIIRKWYQDQKEVALKARLRNYILLESFMISPEKAKEQLESYIASVASPVKT